MPEATTDRAQSAFPAPQKAVTESEAHDWRKTLWVTWVAQLGANAAFSFVMPFIPFYTRELGVTQEKYVALWAGLLVTGTGVIQAIFAPLWGLVADRYGRKLMVQRAMFGGAVVCSLMGLVTNVHQLFALRLLQGALTGTVTAAIALVSSATPKDQRGYALGIMQMAVFSGGAIGPWLGGWIADHFGYRLPFAITGLLLFTGGALVLFGVREPVHALASYNGNGESNKRAPETSLRSVLGVRGFPTLLAVFFMISFSGMVVGPIFPLFVEKLMPHSTRVASITGLLLAVGGIVAGLGAILVGRFSDRIGHKAMLFACTLSSGLSFMLQAAATSVAQLFAIRIAFGFVAGGTGPTMNALVASIAPNHA